MSKKGKTLKTIKGVLCFVLAFIICFAIGETVSVSWRSDPKNIKQYETDNVYINSTDKPYISAHRSGGGIEPEESMLAFKNCLGDTGFSIDVFEFDLHITKDNQLVLLHDDTLDRTTDSDTVFGVEEARPENYTYEELRQLNIGAKFVNEAGEMPYKDITGDDLSDDLKIVKVEDILDFLMSKGDYDYIIEIKNGGELGKKGVDILYQILEERNLLDSVIFGTFKEEVSFYVDENYPKLKRSATINEVLEFYFAALRNDKNFNPSYTVLQIPFNMPWRLAGNLATARVINYAHEHNLAVQYWTINKESEMKYLASVGADCIMTDYPDQLYKVLNENK